MIPFELLGYLSVIAMRIIIDFLIVVENGNDDTDIRLG